MKSRYLREINCEYSYDEDERKEKFDKEKEEYGFASYDTWNIDISFVEFLYIIFNMYNDYNCIDTHFYKFSIDNENFDMQQLIDYIIETSKEYLISRKKDFLNNINLPDKFYKVLKEIMPYMWW